MVAGSGRYMFVSLVAMISIASDGFTGGRGSEGPPGMV